MQAITLPNLSACSLRRCREEETPAHAKRTKVEDEFKEGRVVYVPHRVPNSFDIYAERFGVIDDDGKIWFFKNLMYKRCYSSLSNAYHTRQVHGSHDGVIYNFISDEKFKCYQLSGSHSDGDEGPFFEIGHHVRFIPKTVAELTQITDRDGNYGIRLDNSYLTRTVTEALTVPDGFAGLALEVYGIGESVYSRVIQLLEEHKTNDTFMNYLLFLDESQPHSHVTRFVEFNKYDDRFLRNFLQKMEDYLRNEGDECVQ